MTPRRTEASHRAGFTYLFVITTRAVKKGDELLINYGTKYWQQRRAVEPYFSGWRGDHQAADIDRLRKLLLVRGFESEDEDI